jgi:hypothetical protein
MEVRVHQMRVHDVGAVPANLSVKPNECLGVEIAARALRHDVDAGQAKRFDEAITIAGP